MLERGSLCFFEDILSKLWGDYYLQPDLYPSFTDFVETMNKLIQERHNLSETCITVNESRRTEEVSIYLSIEVCGLAMFGTPLGPIFGSNAGL